MKDTVFAAAVCKKCSAEQLHADGLTMGKGADIFALVSGGRRSDRTPPRESPRRAHGTFSKCNSGLLHFEKVPFLSPPLSANLKERTKIYGKK